MSHYYYYFFGIKWQRWRGNYNRNVKKNGNYVCTAFFISYTLINFYIWFFFSCIGSLSNCQILFNMIRFFQVQINDANMIFFLIDFKKPEFYSANMYITCSSPVEVISESLIKGQKMANAKLVHTWLTFFGSLLFSSTSLSAVLYYSILCYQKKIGSDMLWHNSTCWECTKG